MQSPPSFSGSSELPLTTSTGIITKVKIASPRRILSHSYHNAADLRSLALKSNCTHNPLYDIEPSASLDVSASNVSLRHFNGALHQTPPMTGEVGYPQTPVSRVSSFLSLSSTSSPLLPDLPPELHGSHAATPPPKARISSHLLLSSPRQDAYFELLAASPLSLRYTPKRARNQHKSTQSRASNTPFRTTPFRSMASPLSTNCMAQLRTSPLHSSTPGLACFPAHTLSAACPVVEENKTHPPFPSASPAATSVDTGTTPQAEASCSTSAENVLSALPLLPLPLPLLVPPSPTSTDSDVASSVPSRVSWTFLNAGSHDGSQSSPHAPLAPPLSPRTAMCAEAATAQDWYGFELFSTEEKSEFGRYAEAAEGTELARERWQRVGERSWACAATGTTAGVDDGDAGEEKWWHSDDGAEDQRVQERDEEKERGESTLGSTAAITATFIVEPKTVPHDTTCSNGDHAPCASHELNISSLDTLSLLASFLPQGALATDVAPAITPASVFPLLLRHGLPAALRPLLWLVYSGGLHMRARAHASATERVIAAQGTVEDIKGTNSGGCTVCTVKQEEGDVAALLRQRLGADASPEELTYTQLLARPHYSAALGTLAVYARVPAALFTSPTTTDTAAGEHEGEQVNSGGLPCSSRPAECFSGPELSLHAWAEAVRISAPSTFPDMPPPSSLGPNTETEQQSHRACAHGMKAFSPPGSAHVPFGATPLSPTRTGTSAACRRASTRWVSTSPMHAARPSISSPSFSPAARTSAVFASPASPRARAARYKRRQSFLSPSSSAALSPPSLPSGALYRNIDPVTLFPSLAAARAQEALLSQVEKDVGRTMCNHPLFRSQRGRDALRRLLTAFAYRHPSVGYMQSLNFLAAMLLAVFGLEREELAFWCLCGVAGGVLSVHYSPGVGSLLTLMQAFKAWLAEADPALAGLLLERGVDLSFRAISWVLCLFFTYLPPSLAVVVWDVVLATGAWAHWHACVTAWREELAHASPDICVRVTAGITGAGATSATLSAPALVRIRNAPCSSPEQYAGVVAALMHAARALLATVASRLERCEPHALLATDLIQTAGAHIMHPRAFTDEWLPEERETVVASLQADTATATCSTQRDVAVPGLPRSLAECVKLLPVLLANAQLRQQQEEDLRAQQVHARQARRRGQPLPQEAVLERRLRLGEQTEAEEQAHIVNVGAQLRSAHKSRRLQQRLQRMHTCGAGMADLQVTSPRGVRVRAQQGKSAPAAMLCSPYSPRHKSGVHEGARGTALRRRSHGHAVRSPTLSASPPARRHFGSRASVGGDGTACRAYSANEMIEPVGPCACIDIASRVSCLPSSRGAEAPETTDVPHKCVLVSTCDFLAASSPFVTRRRAVARRGRSVLFISPTSEAVVPQPRHAAHDPTETVCIDNTSDATMSLLDARESGSQLVATSGVGKSSCALASLHTPTRSSPTHAFPLTVTPVLESASLSGNSGSCTLNTRYSEVNPVSYSHPSAQLSHQDTIRHQGMIDEPKLFFCNAASALTTFTSAHYYDDELMAPVSLDPDAELSKQHKNRKSTKAKKRASKRKENGYVVTSSRPSGEKKTVSRRAVLRQSHHRVVDVSSQDEADEWLEYLGAQQTSSILNPPTQSSPVKQAWSTASLCSNESMRSIELQRLGATYNTGTRSSLYIPDDIMRLHQDTPGTQDNMVSTRVSSERKGVSFWRRLTRWRNNHNNETQRMFIAGLGVDIIEHYSRQD